MVVYEICVVFCHTYDKGMSFSFSYVVLISAHTCLILPTNINNIWNQIHKQSLHVHHKTFTFAISEEEAGFAALFSYYMYSAAYHGKYIINDRLQNMDALWKFIISLWFTFLLVMLIY